MKEQLNRRRTEARIEIVDYNQYFVTCSDCDYFYNTKGGDKVHLISAEGIATRHADLHDHEAKVSTLQRKI